jgi:hypothetical protein
MFMEKVVPMFLASLNGENNKNNKKQKVKA